jgi:hypothetical protein
MAQQTARSARMTSMAFYLDPRANRVLRVGHSIRAQNGSDGQCGAAVCSENVDDFPVALFDFHEGYKIHTSAGFMARTTPVVAGVPAGQGGEWIGTAQEFFRSGRCAPGS